jgi:hypothetical protein
MKWRSTTWCAIAFDLWDLASSAQRKISRSRNAFSAVSLSMTIVRPRTRMVMRRAARSQSIRVISVVEFTFLRIDLLAARISWYRVMLR